MSQTELFRVLAAIALLLVAAHAMGRLFARFRQPPVIGEILGGLLLGPTVLGQLLPRAEAWLFPSEGPVAFGPSLVYQLGMLLLMFTAGAEMRTVFSRRDGRSVALIALAGMAVPFAIGLLAVRAIDIGSLLGPADDVTALTLILTCAIAVTSIPVISRIMLDLGIIRTRFARTVLSVAVVEDVILNVIISVALGMVAGSKEPGFGLAHALGVTSAGASAAYHSVASVAFFGLMALVAVVIRRRPWAGTAPKQPGGGTAGGRLDTVAVRMAVLLAVSASCVFLGVAPMFGAFVVGLLSGLTARSPQSDSLGQVRGFAAGFFVPVYFATVGLKLDLVHSFDLWFTAGFILLACAAKALSAYAGARLAKRPKPESLDLAVALNARGGPGIVLATVSFDAGIVNASFFTTLVLTAIVTSQIAGWWLERAVSRGAFVTDEAFAPRQQDESASVLVKAEGG
ncbi:cation:proton antiporter [Streptomyces sp. QL37]|uniref:cation:proton antiporter n=1 Tax=Streptomyces sp. QL37 TaxID=2093747 RepID=UPI000CF2ADC7|nr:cation:proton antiporter [Streptomyces sp. QL37]PPQ57562.1 cation:proton antiporter [Streptomyces sp. QL37]